MRYAVCVAVHEAVEAGGSGPRRWLSFLRAGLLDKGKEEGSGRTYLYMATTFPLGHSLPIAALRGGSAR